MLLVRAPALCQCAVRALPCGAVLCICVRAWACRLQAGKLAPRHAAGARSGALRARLASVAVWCRLCMCASVGMRAAGLQVGAEAACRAALMIFSLVPPQSTRRRSAAQHAAGARSVRIRTQRTRTPPPCCVAAHSAYTARCTPHTCAAGEGSAQGGEGRGRGQVQGGARGRAAGAGDDRAGASLLLLACTPAA